MMKAITKKWLEFADKDLHNAEILFRNKSYEGSIWHCHQAVEKTIKAYLVEDDERLPKTHDLAKLADNAKLAIPKKILNFLHNLNPYYLPIRYPDSALLSKLICNRKITHQIFKTTQEVIKWLKFHLIQSK